jgi:transglutaminase/protease-like cytokinesis protein 3
MGVVVWELLTQLITMAGRISLSLGQNLLLESENLGSSKEESSNGKATQEDADQLMKFENANNKS